MKATIPGDILRLAQERKQTVIRIYIDGRACDPPSGTVDYTGPVTDEGAAELREMVNRWVRNGTI